MQTLSTYSNAQDNESLCSFDLHYHTNIYRLSKAQRDKRLQQHRECLEATNVDFVASTEHGYKGPLDAYLYLRDATEGLHTEILPAVEAVSEEGVDIIFIFRTEDELRRGLEALEPFQWRVTDMNKIRDDLGAISIIPHPFTPGKTGLANIVGEKDFMDLQETSDYVEIHNGSALHFLENGMRNKSLLTPSALQRKVNYTYRLPNEFRLDHVGWSVSSDAHFPSHQTIVGAVNLDDDEGRKPNDWFSFLQKRHKFKKLEVKQQESRQWLQFWHMMQSGYCTFEEAIEKRAQKKGFIQQAADHHPDAA